MKKIITSITIIFISLACMLNYSYAAGEQLEATIEITPSANEVEAGDTITFTFVTKNIVNAESGKIFAIGGKMVYDTEFFELDTTNGITLSEETGLFNSTNAVSEGGTNGTISLKVKTDATGSGVVEFSELEASDGRLEDMETLGTATTSDQTFTITIKQAPEGNPGDGSGNEECAHTTYETKYNNTQHWEQCSECNETKAGSTATHTYGSYTDNKNGTHSATCTVCGYKRTESHNYVNRTCEHCSAVEPEDDECEHTYGGYTDNKNGTHTATCSKCGEKLTESHATDKACEKCRYTPATSAGTGNNGSSNNNQGSGDTATKDYPKAGLSTLLVVGILAIIAVAIVMYRKNQKYQDIR